MLCPALTHHLALQISSNQIDQKMRDDLERLKKIRFSSELSLPALSFILHRTRSFVQPPHAHRVSGADSEAAHARNHRGLRHYWGLRVRGQHTKTTGRRGKTVGVSKKKG